MTTAAERLNQWLRDAHAMEEQAEQMLKAQSGRIESYPDLKARIDQHIEETRSQRQRLERCMETRGISSSSIKDITGQMTAMMQGMGGMVAGDEIVKGAMAGYTFEHMEIASYKVLIAAAEAEGDNATAEACRQICREEEAMASWLADHLDEVTRMHLSREEAGADEAKR